MVWVPLFRFPSRFKHRPLNKLETEELNNIHQRMADKMSYGLPTEQESEEQEKFLKDWGDRCDPQSINYTQLVLEYDDKQRESEAEAQRLDDQKQKFNLFASIMYIIEQGLIEASVENGVVSFAITAKGHESIGGC